MTALKLGVSLFSPKWQTVLMIVADVSSHEPDEINMRRELPRAQGARDGSCRPTAPRFRFAMGCETKCERVFVPVALMNSMTAALKMKSRSKMRYLGAVS